MKTCPKCAITFEGLVEYVHHKCYTKKEWDKFNKPYSAENVGNEFQYFNFFTQRLESYEYITIQEAILSKYDVFLINHRNRRKVGKMVKVPLKERIKDGLKNLPNKINQKNLDAGLKKFDQGMAQFNKEMNALSNGLGGKSTNKKNLEKLWGAKKNNNIEKLWGSKKKSNSVPIWGKPAKKRRTKRKSSSSKSAKWDRHEKNLEKLWGKKR